MKQVILLCRFIVQNNRNDILLQSDFYFRQSIKRLGRQSLQCFSAVLQILFGWPKANLCRGLYLTNIATLQHFSSLRANFSPLPFLPHRICCLLSHNLIRAVEAIDMPLLNAYLDSLGTPNFRTGVNFAQAGCSITPATPTSVSPFSFGLQIKQFFAFKDKVTKLLSKGMEVCC